MAGAFQWDGPTPMGLANYVQQQGQMGKQQGEDSRLARLVSGAMADPSKRQSNLAEIASFRPEAAFQAQGQFDQQTDRKYAELGKRAAVLAGAPEAMRGQVWAQLRPELEATFGMQGLPADVTPEIIQTAQQLARVYGGEGENGRNSLTPSVSSVEDAYRRGVITKEEYDKGMRIALDLAPGASAPRITWVDKYDPATGTTYKVPMQSSGVDYTGGAPSLTYGSQPQPAPSTQPQPQPANGSYADQPAELPRTPLLDTFSQQFPGFRATSTYRDPQHNEKVGGVSNSYHTRDGGAAIDGYPSSPQELAQIEQWAAQNGMEVLKYPGGRVHVEPRPGMTPTSNVSAAPPARPADPNANSPYLRTNIVDVGGGAIQSGPSNADVEAQKEREAAATARGGIAGRREMGPDFADEATLRKEYDDRVKESRGVVEAYERVSDAARNDSAAGDLSLIFAYMKMLDPGSVVREAEFANAQNAAGYPEQIQNAWNRWKTGERLGAAQRADFVRQAESLRSQAQRRMDDAATRYRGMAPDYNMSPDRIAPAPQGGSEDIDSLVDRWSR